MALFNAYGELNKIISCQVLLHQAATGSSLTKSSIENIKNTLKNLNLQKLDFDDVSLFTKGNITQKDLEELFRDKNLTQIITTGFEFIDKNAKLDIQNLYICALEEENVHKKLSNQLEY